MKLGVRPNSDCRDNLNLETHVMSPEKKKKHPEGCFHKFYKT